MAMLRAQASPIPQVVDVMQSMIEAKRLVEHNPSEVMRLVMTQLTLEQLKSLQVSLASTGNADFKKAAVAKACFLRHYTTISETRKQLDLAEAAMKDMAELMLLSQYGDEDDGNIAWSRVIKTLIDLVDDKARQTAAAPPPAHGLGA
eukprot:4729785-Karenia_brevis.AAC.1